MYWGQCVFCGENTLYGLQGRLAYNVKAGDWLIVRSCMDNSLICHCRAAGFVPDGSREMLSEIECSDRNEVRGTLIVDRKLPFCKVRVFMPEEQIECPAAFIVASDDIISEGVLHCEQSGEHICVIGEAIADISVGAKLVNIETGDVYTAVKMYSHGSFTDNLYKGTRGVRLYLSADVGVNRSIAERTVLAYHKIKSEQN